ncbi:hypothetical protein H5410_019509 [Solanum commersonii]|uniref:Bet v I/Major latex protein domain-containing protein n=1 Tax=Solanum commersonii TaxID=4109 RepID=A0A9J5Z9S7_SOLCO|nr:hypothetical protein H5410_019509 [Solanum commersonii]
MDLKGKLITSIEVNCGGHSIHDILHTNMHHVPTISRGQKKNSKQIIEAIDPHKKLIRWKFIEGDVLEMYKVKCGGHSIHDIFHTNAHHVPTISRAFNRFEIHEVEIVKIDSIISWNYNDGGQNKFTKQIIEDIHPHKKSIR